MAGGRAEGFGCGGPSRCPGRGGGVDGSGGGPLVVRRAAVVAVAWAPLVSPASASVDALGRNGVGGRALRCTPSPLAAAAGSGGGPAGRVTSPGSPATLDAAP